MTAENTGIALPFTYSNGTKAMLGDNSTFGYPTQLYPNITYTALDTPDPLDPTVNSTLATAFLDFPLNASSALLLGPLQINDTYALLSLTLPIVDNSRRQFVLGYLTVVASAASIIDVTQSREGLAKTGVVLLVGPNRRENQFKYEQRPANFNYTPPSGALNNASVRYVLPPIPAPGESDRHASYK